MRTIAVAAPAKVNLVLRVGVRDESGYHQIETLFCKLALADEVRVTVDGAPDDALTCDGPALPRDGLGPRDANLAWRALIAYRTATGWPGPSQIAVHKRIPVGGGLGGGSADAAGVLRALDTLAPAPIGTAGLLSIGATLGADVPFLVSDAVLAWAWGRGDRLLALPALPARDLVLVPHAEGVHTASAYRWLAEAGGGTARGARGYALDDVTSWSAVARAAHNDFTAVVRARHTGVNGTLAALEAAAAAARAAGVADAFALMSGSGATCLLVGADAPAELPQAVRTRSAEGVVGASRDS
ncbi:MAG: hypothetical protein MUF00_02865 [Gemmatimonadaceae bacterium]|jgi:4-diphosphocytidyl-2-C-methyl-D-erythritol kinase|nr:hypothetical protein [Gemmatimonadaceae bacterium]